MKHYMDISRIRTDDESEFSYDNTKGFEVGDHIQISEKIDGANSSIALDENGNLVAFSRKNELSATNNLRGFWNFVQTLDKTQFADLGNMILFGEWLCLSGDTIIRKTAAGKNNNYMTLKEMYEIYTSPTKDKYHYNPYKGNHSVITYLYELNGQTYEELLDSYKKHAELKKWDPKTSFNRIINYNIKREYICKKDNKYYLTINGEKEYQDFRIRNNWWNRYGLPSIFSLYHNQDLIMPNQINNIVYTGKKIVYKVTTRSGFNIKATMNHPFYTPEGYKKLEELKINDCVAVTDYILHRTSRACGDGQRQMTKLQNEYKEKIGHCERCGRTEDLQLHHRNRNWRDNSIDNWEVLCKRCHMEEHKNDKKFKGFEYSYYFDNIVSIEEIGEEDCYDLEMSGDENCANFVANGFIVHNCKHTVKYLPESYNQWYVYDLYDKDTEQWLPQTKVKAFAEAHGLIYIHVLYDGPFVSWEHCKTFLNNPAYGESQEGCFDFRTKILMSDGTQKKINQIKVGDMVKSYNHETNMIEDKKVINVFYNGKKNINQWNSIAIFPKGISGNDSINGFFCCTKNHKFYDGVGYSEINRLNYVYHYGKKFDAVRKQMFLGLLASDMCYCCKEKAFRLNQLESKSSDFIDIFKPFISNNRRVQLSGKNSKIMNIWFLKQHTVEFLDEYIENDRINFIKVFRDLDIIGWSFFFIGDGCGSKNGKIDFCFASNTDEEVDIAVSCIKSVFKINSGCVYKDKRVKQGSGKSYCIGEIDGKKIMKAMSKYIPNSHRYKIRAIQDADDFINLPDIQYGLVRREIYSKKEASELARFQVRRNINAYDLEVEDNHNYFANGCLVHNCVIKNQSKLNDPDIRFPFCLKIVNEFFKETQLKNHVKKVLDPQNEADKKAVEEDAERVVTEARVRKDINKMIDEGILPEQISPKDMGVIAKHLPKRIFDDVMKEESDSIDISNQFIGKAINNRSMALVKAIVLGE